MATKETPTSYLGQCCYCEPVSVFLQTRWPEFRDQMVGGFSKVSKHTPGMLQKRAWKKCFSALQSALPRDRRFQKLYICFEYVLPNRRRDLKNPENATGRRVDVVLIYKNAVVMMEFKHKDFTEEAASKAAKQLKAYETRLQKYHQASKNMRISTLVVDTKASEPFAKGHLGTRCCSGDAKTLLAELRRMVAKDPEPYPDIEKWLHSAYVDVPVTASLADTIKISSKSALKDSMTIGESAADADEAWDEDGWEDDLADDEVEDEDDWDFTGEDEDEDI